MKTWLRRRTDSFRYAFRGVADLFQHTPNARIHLLAAVLAIGAGWWFSISPTEWCLVIFAIVSVISAEAFNTALEYLTDLASPDFHVLAGKAKDVAAAAVLVAAIGAALVGIIVFLPYLAAAFHHYF